jgi:hypothetical protein
VNDYAVSKAEVAVHAKCTLQDSSNDITLSKRLARRK